MSKVGWVRIGWANLLGPNVLIKLSRAAGVAQSPEQTFLAAATTIMPINALLQPAGPANRDGSRFFLPPPSAIGKIYRSRASAIGGQIGNVKLRSLNYAGGLYLGGRPKPDQVVGR